MPRVCFVLDSDPERHFGGTPAVVRELMKRIDGCKISGSRNIIINMMLMILAPIRISMKRCDVVNIHDTHGYFYTFWPRRRRIIYTCHGLWKNYYKVLPPASFAGKLKAAMAERLQKRIIGKADRITAVSGSVKRQIIEEYGIEERKIDVVYNGVDTKRFSPGKHGNALIWVGDNPELKGLQKAIEYAKKRKKKLIIAGIEGKSDETSTYLGKVHHETMPEIYRMAGTLVFFSKFEGHPLVPLEAAACGLRIIASKESNVEILPMKNGMYVANGKTARRTAKRYDWSVRARKYTKIFEEFA